jgi:hypothetical protein
VDKVPGPTCRSAGLLAGRVHLTGTSGTLVGGDPWVPMSPRRRLCSCSFGILFLLFDELFLSDQGFQGAYHDLTEYSGQVKVCGLVTLGDCRLLDSLGALGVLGELLEIVGASRNLGVHDSRSTVPEMENGYS